MDIAKSLCDQLLQKKNKWKKEQILCTAKESKTNANPVLIYVNCPQLTITHTVSPDFWSLFLHLLWKSISIIFFCKSPDFRFDSGYFLCLAWRSCECEKSLVESYWSKREDVIIPAPATVNGE